MKLSFALFALMLTCPCFGQVIDSPINLRRTVTVEVVEKTKNAVVYISSTKLVAQRMSPIAGDSFFQEFGPIRNVPVGSLGSGFIVHPDGYIVTNNHVIDRARQIKVELIDGRKFDADLISADADADLAILRIHADAPLPVLELGDSSDLMAGEPVIAEGNPLGYSHSVSTGIVAAIHRDLKDSEGNVLLHDLVQTDAAINPGNSGGPLLNAYGQVIGINTAIRGDAQNIGFAIGVNRLRDLIPVLMNPSQVDKLDMPIKLKEKRTITPPSTVNVKVLNENGDAVTSIAGHKPRDIIDAYATLLEQTEHHPFAFGVQGEQTRQIDPAPAPLPDGVTKAKTKLGITVEPLTPMLAEKYGLSAEHGVLVREVDHGSIAEKAGVEPGDVILFLGKFPIRNLTDFGERLAHLPDSGKVFVAILRGNTVGKGYLDLS